MKLYFIVVLDEFQELDALTRKDFDVFARLRSVWQKQRRTAYIISRSARSMLLSLIGEETSPFFQHFSLVDVGPFSHESAIELLRQHDAGEHSIPAEIVEKAVTVLGGNPFYLQLLGEMLTAGPDVPDAESLKDALQSLLFSSMGRLALFFEREFRRAVGRSTYLAATLDALAEGPATLTEIASRIQTSSAATSGYIDRLKDMTQRAADGRHALIDPVFGLWLKWKRPGGTVVPMSVVGDAAEQTTAYALSSMAFDLVYQSRASRGAFDLLATRGATQLGVQFKRSAPPLRFTRPEWARMEAEAARLGWHWVLAAVGQDDGIAILDPGRAKKGREVRVGGNAAIENLLKWLDARKRKK